MFFRSQELHTTTSSSQSLVRIQAFVSSRRFVRGTKHSFSVRSPLSASAREPSYLSAFAQDHWYGASRLPNRVYNSSKLPRKWRRCLVLEGWNLSNSGYSGARCVCGQHHRPIRARPYMTGWFL
jgi:hypothetical protein